MSLLLAYFDPVRAIYFNVHGETMPSEDRVPKFHRCGKHILALVAKRSQG